jgi:hypothetical protein
MKLAFYTCFYGSSSNEAFSVPPLPSAKYDCFYFTNNHTIMERLRHTRWIGVYEPDKKMTEDVLESCMIGKHVKVLPHLYTELNNYDYTCFLDSKLAKVNETFVEDLIQRFFVEDGYALLLRRHWFVGNNVWEEFHESMLQSRYRNKSDEYLKYIERQLANGFSETTAFHCACGFLIRNMRHTAINDLNETWYKHIEECGIQDQISFFFAKQMFECFIHAFREEPF